MILLKETNPGIEGAVFFHWLHVPLTQYLNFIHIEKGTANEPQNGESTYKLASSLLSAGFQISPQND